MSQNHPLIKGTIILTITGFASRIIGFFYRIFLSRNFGEESMGIYQLIAPAMALAFSFTAAGIQTAISKYVASETTTKDYKSSSRYLLVGITISLVLSAIFGFALYKYALPIATYALLEPRCATLLRMFSLSIPFGAVHACINGYFYGIKKTTVPAVTQILEQIIRVASVFLLTALYESKQLTPTIGIAVIGILAGEAVSMLVSVIAIYIRFYSHNALKRGSTIGIAVAGKNIFVLSLPLMANRIVINFLQSIEAIYIPNCLQKYGMSVSQALSIYGVLTGMALPLILFPSAITNSISVLLLPIVSEAESNNNTKTIQKATRKTIKYCLLLGFACTLGFLLIGRSAGTYLFKSDLAGTFIISLSFICPFLYLTSTLSSVLHGLGKTFQTFIYSTISICIRLFFIFFLVPIYGIRGYLWGLLVSQLVVASLTLWGLRKYILVKTK